MSRAVWVDAGNDPAYAKLSAYGITVPYFDPRDSRVTASYLDAVKAHAGIEACGIYTAYNWLPAFSDPAAYAEWVDAQLRRIRWRGNALVYLDIEKGSNGVDSSNFASYVTACLARWRQLRPLRATALTIEGMQGGLVTLAMVGAIITRQVQLAPQLYRGDMTPLAHSPIIDLLIAGVPGERLEGMYDAAALPYRWRGCAFTQGRLV